MSPLAIALDILQADGGPASDHRNMGAGYILPTLKSVLDAVRKMLRKKDEFLTDEEKKAKKARQRAANNAGVLINGDRILRWCEPLAFHIYFAVKMRYVFKK